MINHQIVTTVANGWGKAKGRRDSMSDRRGRNFVSIVIIGAIATALAGCSSPTTKGAGSAGIESSAPTAGGVLRVGEPSDALSDNLDPTGEYALQGWSPLEALVRTLVTYKNLPGQAGLQLVPDLATTVPAPTDHGLVYTFYLKSGLKFGPPLGTAITSQDIAYAFERINTASLAAQYGFYYDGVIAGMTGTAKSPEPISGIQTPNADTIVFHLTKPTGDFLSRLVLPATAPIPQPVAHCFSTAGGYGDDVISSGPYMLEGAQAVNMSSCKTITPMEGMDPSSQIVLVRNPDYNAATDRQSGRNNYPNAIVIKIDPNISDIFARIQSGSLDASFFVNPPNTILRTYSETANLRDRISSVPTGNTEYFQMNLTVPPFTNIYVRRAVNDVLDKTAILQQWGGRVIGSPATHLIPPNVLGNVPAANFDLYPTAGSNGDLAKAKAEMRLSPYDPKHDGMCDIATDCRNLVLINKDVAPFTTMEPVVVADLAKIGIQVIPRELESGAAQTAIESPKALIAAQIGTWWTYDYPDPATYYDALFGAIQAVGNANFSMLGLTKEEASSLGITYPSGGIPSVTPEINACEVIIVGSQRDVCWAHLERKMMATVVPYAPLLWFNQVTILANDVTTFDVPPFQRVALTNDAVSNRLTLKQALSSS
jgi:peptide/nickel transport system substrate-binding protein